MTVKELREKLQELEKDDKSDYKVTYIDEVYSLKVCEWDKTVTLYD